MKRINEFWLLGSTIYKNSITEQVHLFLLIKRNINK